MHARHPLCSSEVETFSSFNRGRRASTNVVKRIRGWVEVVLSDSRSCMVCVVGTTAAVIGDPMTPIEGSLLLHRPLLLRQFDFWTWFFRRSSPRASLSHSLGCFLNSARTRRFSVVMISHVVVNSIPTNGANVLDLDLTWRRDLIQNPSRQI